MKTKKQVLSENKQHSKIINAVLRNIDEESISDINNYGIGGGFGNFIYYSDTVKFFNRYKKEIIELAKERAEQLGEDLFSMIANFNCLRGNYCSYDISEAIHGKGENTTQIKNALSWFAAEEVCRMFEE